MPGSQKSNEAQRGFKQQKACRGSQTESKQSVIYEGGSLCAELLGFTAPYDPRICKGN